MASQRPPSGRPPSQSSSVQDSGRPGSKAGASPTPSVLSAQIKVTDRPVTQQGLSGMETGRKGPQRRILDKSYYLGLLRCKITELTTENNKLQRDIEVLNQKNSVHLSYEKRSQSLAGEIKDLRGQLADYNLLVDKLNTNTEMEEVMNEIGMMKEQNDREAQSIEAMFTRRREKEDLIRALEREMEREKQAAAEMVKKMPPEKQAKYAEMKAVNEELLQELAVRQEELDALMTRKEALEAELKHSQVKQEAAVLYERLRELEVRRDALQAEDKAAIPPQEERERLLKQVKEDNQKIASIERHLKETREKIHRLTEELRQLDEAMRDQYGERTQKYKTLQRKEMEMDAYSETFESHRVQEVEHIRKFQTGIVTLLEQSSATTRRMTRLSAVGPCELEAVQEDLSLNETEMQKSRSTAEGLSSECERLEQDLLRVARLEGKMQAEINSLKELIRRMSEGLQTYRDLEALKASEEQRIQRLREERAFLKKRRDTLRTVNDEMKEGYVVLSAELQDNETYARLLNLERKWKYLEKNNSVMKEFIASKSMESDYRPVKKNVTHMLSEHNQRLASDLHKQRPV